MTMQMKSEHGKASIWRKESYNHGTTAKIEWIVKYQQPDTGKTIIVRECATKKEAMEWALIYSK